MALSFQIGLCICTWILVSYLLYSPVSTYDGGLESVGSLATSYLNNNQPCLNGDTCITVNLTHSSLTTHIGDTVRLDCQYNIRGNGSITKLTVHWGKQVHGSVKSLWIAENFIAAQSQMGRKVGATNVVNRHYITSSVAFPEFLSVHTLWILNVQSHDSGDYQCTVMVENEASSRRTRYAWGTSKPSVIAVKAMIRRRIARQSQSIKSAPNWALGQRTWQRNTYTNFYSRLAVDGSSDGVLGNNHCAHTLPGASPWWFVFLNRVIHINTVVLANSYQSDGGLSNIRIGTYIQTSSGLILPDINSINVCVRHDEAMDRGEIRAFPCDVTGSFLVIIIEKYQELILCEVEVFGRIPGAATENFALGKPASQSSTLCDTYCTAYASLAVDGNFEADLNKGSCSQTQKDINPWWALDLQFYIQIEHVVITAVLNLISSIGLLSMVRIGTTNKDPKAFSPTISNINMCVRFDGELGLGQTWAFNCDASGRWVVIILEKTDALSLCEVAVYGEKAVNNFALGKPTRQSSTNGSADASLAVDGNSDSNFDLGHSCTMTNEQLNPWWAVDLQKTIEIEEVVIKNSDSIDSLCCDILIGISHTDVGNIIPTDSSINVCGVKVEAFSDSLTFAIPCPAVAKHVIILLQKVGHLTLCEVKVHGKIAATNFALGKSAWQSSTATFNMIASLAVDGNSYSNHVRGKSCTLTIVERNPWWAVDLQMVVQIEEVVVTIREFDGDRLSLIRIGTTDNDPNSISPTLNNINVCARGDEALSSSETFAFPCDATSRYVVIILEKTDSLSLCEVKVHGGLLVVTTSAVVNFTQSPESQKNGISSDHALGIGLGVTASIMLMCLLLYFFLLPQKRPKMCLPRVMSEDEWNITNDDTDSHEISSNA